MASVASQPFKLAGTNLNGLLGCDRQKVHPIAFQGNPNPRDINSNQAVDAGIKVKGIVAVCGGLQASYLNTDAAMTSFFFFPEMQL